MPSPKAIPIILSPLERASLESISRCSTKPYRLVQRARLVLLAAEGLNNTTIGKKLNLGQRSVRKWRSRWQQASLEWSSLEETQSVKSLLPQIESILSDRPRPGSPGEFSVEQIVEIVAVACEPPARSGLPISHWTTRELSHEAIERGLVKKISPRSVGRFLKRSHVTAPSKSLLAQSLSQKSSHL